MKTKRNKFLTFLFSLVPGAGHMFMGFMKRGVSLMGLCTLLVLAVFWLHCGTLFFFFPIIWAYAFFDCINIGYSSDEVFAHFEDHYLFIQQDDLFHTVRFSGKSRPVLGGLLLLFGVFLLYISLVDAIPALNNAVYARIMNLMQYLPQLLVSAVIVGLGIWLIVRKRKEGDDNA